MKNNQLKQINVGSTADIYEMDTGILKLFKEDHQHRCQRESLVMSQLEVKEKSFVKIPKFYKRVSHEDKAGIFMERVSGKSLDDQFSIFKAKEKVTILVKVQMEIQDKFILGEECQIKDYFWSQIEKTNFPKEVLRVLDKLIIALPDGDKVCHGDFHGGNIMLSDTGFTVIDWSEAGLGDELVDLARTLTLFGVHPYSNHFEQRRKKILNQATFRINKIILNHYCKQFEEVKEIDYEKLRKWQIITDAAALSNLGENKEEIRICENAIKQSIDYFY